ncbi:hypothetical protein Mapa_002984 [Marchantia paleacea]|nr:hypothetical protein Mapa_002984 [Marchantia paleacea]
MQICFVRACQISTGFHDHQNHPKAGAIPHHIVQLLRYIDPARCYKGSHSEKHTQMQRPRIPSLFVAQQTLQVPHLPMRHGRGDGRRAQAAKYGENCKEER